MPRYAMQDGTVVDTERASKSWEELRYKIGAVPSSGGAALNQRRQTLHRSRRGRYYIEFVDTGDAWKLLIGKTPNRRGHVEWQSPEAATRWLIVNDYDLPEELKRFEEEV